MARSPSYGSREVSMRPSEICLVDWTWVRVPRLRGPNGESTSVKDSVCKMTTPETLAAWTQLLKVATRRGRTQYVIEKLVMYDLAGAGGTEYSILLASCAAGDRGDVTIRSERVELATIRSEHVELARAFLDRGADPNLRDAGGWTPLHYAARGFGDGSADLVELLVAAGGNVGARANPPPDPNFLHYPERVAGSPLVVVADHLCTASWDDDASLDGEFWRRDDRYGHCQRIARVLVRAGAPLYELTIHQFGHLYRRTYTSAMNARQRLHVYRQTCQLILDVRAAAGPRAYRMQQRKQVLLLRSLALKGRAEPRDACMTFLVDSPNEIAWKILEYWRTELEYPPRNLWF